MSLQQICAVKSCHCIHANKEKKNVIHTLTFSLATSKEQQRLHLLRQKLDDFATDRELLVGVMVIGMRIAILDNEFVVEIPMRERERKKHKCASLRFDRKRCAHEKERRRTLCWSVRAPFACLAVPKTWSRVAHDQTAPKALA